MKCDVHKRTKKGRDSLKYCIVIGSSRGLGAALVEELLKHKSYHVTGVARTGLEDISNHDKWADSGRYQHVSADISTSDCVEPLRAICAGFSHNPVCIIFNAALVMADVNGDGSIDYEVFNEINKIGIDGLGNAIRAFEPHLLKYGGILVGVSSVAAIVPPIVEQRVAYPASKAYMDMALRCLRFAWRKKVRVVTVRCGHLGGSGANILSRLLMPSYEIAARKIVDSISGGKVANKIEFPFLYTKVYRFIHTFVPDFIYFRTLRLLFKSKFLLQKMKQ